MNRQFPFHCQALARPGLGKGTKIAQHLKHHTLQGKQHHSVHEYDSTPKPVRAKLNGVGISSFNARFNKEKCFLFPILYSLLSQVADL